MKLVVEELGFMLAPHGKECLCYELFKWRPERVYRGKQCRAEWVSMECYPSTVEHGLKLMYDRAVAEKDVEVDIPGAIDQMGLIRDSITAALRCYSEVK